ncbi:NUDIX hydrolase, partial [Alphaproteobacteria bacterium]|nr:NUDIX hydrolase [Alphaproteobacteria bacterium]
MSKQETPRYGTPASTPGEYRDDSAKAVRPKEASTLIVVRQAKQPKILMGKRAASHKFMPNKFVF